jgi:hypothetical protein
MSGSKARYLAELEEFEIAKRDERQQQSGARMTGAGKATAAIGLIGGGIPGIKPKNPWDHSAGGGSMRGLMTRNAPTGVLGARIGAHESQVSYLNSKKTGDTYVKGRREGKLIAEHNVLRGMKRARRGTYGVTAAGLSLVAAGKHREKVNKADHKQDRRLGAAATTAGLSGGVVAPTLAGFGRHYRKQAAGHLDSAYELAPSGKTSSTALRRKIGVHHGQAAAANHFADVFRSHGRVFGVVGAGSGALALRQAHNQRVKKGSGTIDPGVPVQTKYRMQGKRRVELDPKDYGKDLNPHRAKLKAREDRLKVSQGIGARQLRQKSAKDREKFFQTPAGKAWLRRSQLGTKGKVSWGPVGKRDGQPLRTSINEHDAARLVAEHGLTGSLPKHLNREQRMAAYEARYVSAGGHKAHKWQHRANEAEKTRVAGVAVGTAGLGGILASKHRKIGGRLPRLGHRSDVVAVGGGVAAGVGELYGAHARKKRSSYASAPAGVASSALRRMQGYTPQEH